MSLIDYYEHLGAVNGEDRDPAESAEAHEPTVVLATAAEIFDDPWDASIVVMDDPWGPGLSLEDAPF